MRGLQKIKKFTCRIRMIGKKHYHLFKKIIKRCFRSTVRNYLFYKEQWYVTEELLNKRYKTTYIVFKGIIYSVIRTIIYKPVQAIYVYIKQRIIKRQVVKLYYSIKFVKNPKFKRYMHLAIRNCLIVDLNTKTDKRNLLLYENWTLKKQKIDTCYNTRTDLHRLIEEANKWVKEYKPQTVFINKENMLFVIKQGSRFPSITEKQNIPPINHDNVAVLYDYIYNKFYNDVNESGFYEGIMFTPDIAVFNVYDNEGNINENLTFTELPVRGTV